jgi:flavin-dependent dehydrogenase
MKPTHSKPVEVIVLGGGPAGTAAALALSHLGRSVTLLERSRYDSPRVGEALPPEVRPPLTELGLWDRFIACGPIPSPGTAAAWGRPDLQDNDHITNASGPGWHVDRARFDAMLAIAAEAAGAEVIRGARLSRSQRTRAGTWHIEAITDDGTAIERRAPALVDATGRRAVAARNFGNRRLTHDRLVGLWRLIDPPTSRDPCDRRTLIEAVECGWWYSAFLPDGRHAAAFMTDSDLLPSGPATRNRAWHTYLAQAPHTKARLGSAPACSCPRIVPAFTSRLQVTARPDWPSLAVGDAAMSFDPLSAQGVTWAMESALAAARALDAHLSGDRSLTDDYVRRADIDFNLCLEERRAVYSQERRWPNSPFWRRRAP